MDEKEYSKKMEKEDMDAYYSLALNWAFLIALRVAFLLFQP